MIERMAEAIRRETRDYERSVGASFVTESELTKVAAKAALTALQDPTPEMVEAGAEATDLNGWPVDDRARDEAKSVFNAMIQAAGGGE
jgi:hypothetical protein